MQKPTDRIHKLTDQENALFDEMLLNIRKIREDETNKYHSALIAKLNIKLFNESLEFEVVKFNSKTIK